MDYFEFWDVIAADIFLYFSADQRKMLTGTNATSFESKVGCWRKEGKKSERAS